MVFTFWPFIVIGLCISDCLQEICDSIEIAVIFCHSSYYQMMKTIESSHFFSEFSCYTASFLCTVNSSSCSATFSCLWQGICHHSSAKQSWTQWNILFHRWTRAVLCNIKERKTKGKNIVLKTACTMYFGPILDMHQRVFNQRLENWRKIST